MTNQQAGLCDWLKGQIVFFWCTNNLNSKRIHNMIAALGEGVGNSYEKKNQIWNTGGKSTFVYEIENIFELYHFKKLGRLY